MILYYPNRQKNILLCLLIPGMISSGLSMIWLSCVLWIMTSFYAAYIIYTQSLKKNPLSRRRKKSKLWLSSFLSACFFGLSQIVYSLLMPYLKVQPENSYLYRGLSLVPDLCICLLCVFLFSTLYRHKNKSALDVPILSILFSILFISVILLHPYLDRLSVIDYYYFYFHILLNIVSLVFLSIFIFISKKNVLRSNFKYIFLGLSLYLMADFASIYLYFSYRADHAYLHWVFCFGISLFAFASIENKKTDEIIYEGEDDTIYKFNMIKLLFLLFFILSFIYSKNVITSFVAISIIIFYLVINKITKNNQSSFRLVEMEKNVTSSLDDLVKNRSDELLKLNKSLEIRSITDHLTGLYNRRHYINTLDKLVETKNISFSIICIGIDRFKHISDTYGHDVGDILLKFISRRLKNTLLSNGTVFRLGGDEFAVILENAITKEALSLYTQRLINEMAQPIDVFSYRFSLESRVSIVSYPEYADTRENLMKYSNIAMHEAKLYSYSTYIFFNDEMKNSIERKNRLELAFKEVSLAENITFLYEPQYDLAKNQLIGMESSFVWNHPQEGIIPFEEVMIIAEASGRVQEVSLWSFNQILLQIKKWNLPCHRNLKMGINISEKQLRTPDILRSMMRLIHELDIHPSWIDFEISESSIMYSYEFIEQFLNQLSAMGISVSMEKFGEGYSSLSFINKLPINRLKISGKLVKQMTEKQKGLIIKAIIMMSEGLHLNVIAEGVSTKEELELLRQMDCHQAQGDVLGKAMEYKLQY